MAYVITGVFVGVMAATLTAWSGAGLLMVSVAYVGGGTAVMTAALVCAILFDGAETDIRTEAMLASNR